MPHYNYNWNCQLLRLSGDLKSIGKIRAEFQKLTNISEYMLKKHKKTTNYLPNTLIRAGYVLSRLWILSLEIISINLTKRAINTGKIKKYIHFCEAIVIRT